MSPIIWLAIPVLALLAASIAVSWAGRPRRRADTQKSVRRFARFQAAMSSADSESSTALD